MVGAVETKAGRYFDLARSWARAERRSRLAWWAVRPAVGKEVGAKEHGHGSAFRKAIWMAVLAGAWSPIRGLASI